MPVAEGPTSEVGLEPPHRAGLVVASSCRVVVGVGVGIVAAGSVVVAEEPHLLEELAASSLLCCFFVFENTETEKESTETESAWVLGCGCV